MKMKENHPKSQLPGVGLILVQPWVEIKEQKYCSSPHWLIETTYCSMFY